MRVRLIVGASLLVAASVVAVAQDKKEPEVVTKTKKQLADLEKQVGETRGEKFSKPVQVGWKTDDEFVAFVKQDLDNDLPPEKAGKLSRAYGTLGLVPRGYDLRQGFLDAVQSQALAFYDPKSSTFFLVKLDAPEAVAMPGMFHELVHALQDQRFDLKKYYESAPKDDDDAAARRFVVEGEAQYATTVWQVKQQGAEAMLDDLLDRMAKMSREELGQMQRQQAGMLGDGGKTLIEAQDKCDKLPIYVYSSLVDPYIKGSNMIAKVVKKGGWKAVDDLFKNPPSSTSQLLHAKRLRERQEPVAIELPDLSGDLGGGVKKTLENTIGELGVRCLLEQNGVSEEDAAKAAKGWTGDRLVAYEKDGAAADGSGTIVVWVSTWKTPEAAKAFADATDAYLKKVPGSILFTKEGSSIVKVLVGVPGGDARNKVVETLDAGTKTTPAVK